jgi:hypothetical protein
MNPFLFEIVPVTSVQDCNIRAVFRLEKFFEFTGVGIDISATHERYTCPATYKDPE